ncbi:DUF3331 domain-containing protein [Caballeronia sordidicola]|uniref:DUF3331 domain-containing protein n=1 Tax=Caballeronia sordidicola TaxID=196367 RepID=UPI0005565FFC|nr:DUF3331 domain-containing protein [Caballeronia sordidicola]
MTALARSADPWLQTVRSLTATLNRAAVPAPQRKAVHPFLERLTRAWERDHPHVASPSASPQSPRPFPEAVVRVIERPSSATAIVYWSDAATCHYGYQGWRVTTATSDGACALTGAAIHRGDSVYRPSQRDPKPQNASAMILAASMPQDETSDADLQDQHA